ncbi:hypothetical protein SAMN06296952_0993 [Oscillospiraceae bacterium]|nr:hypothetical protein SAMN06296952_0993 [Oscillospiraceae bacterium]
MKKCPDCGMTIANQAIRCPKCKYNFSEGSDAGDTAVPAAAAAVSAAATGTPVNASAGIMPMVDVTKDNVDELYGQLKAAVVKRKTEFDHFIDFLENRTSWLTAPADTEGALACEKGLLIRSVAVTKQLLRIKDTIMPQLDEESAIIIGLFHDVGKVGVEGKPYFLVEEHLSSSSSALGLSFSSRISTPGTSSSSYSINPKLVGMDVGVRSLYLVSQYMLVSEDEAQAISYADKRCSVGGALSPYTLILGTAIDLQKNIYENKDTIDSYSFTVLK